MSSNTDDITPDSTGPRPAAGLPARLVVELLIGLGFAVVLVIVAWASSNAIRFVYGGY
jgi:hypothetical protein